MKTALSLCLFAFALTAGAQEKTTLSTYRFADATQLWLTTGNAAGMTLDTALVNRGFARFGYRHQGGDFYRVQEGKTENRLQFYTERYQHIGRRLYGFGTFGFDYGREKQRSWSDNVRTYLSNPMVAASAISGRYDFQNFAIHAGLATTALGHVRLGVLADYKVGDLSRLTDPRSRAQYLDYQITPSLNYTIGRHTLGLSGHYRRYKEKVPNVQSVQDANMMYYVLSGLEHATGTLNGYTSYSRQWVDHNFGAELTYGYRSGAYSSVTSLSLQCGSEQVTEPTYKYEPGHFCTYRYGVSTHHRLYAGRLMHSVDAVFGYEQGYADEYRQTLHQERDSVHGYSSFWYETTLNYRKRYQLKLMNLNFHYRLSFTEGNSVRGYAGLRFSEEWARQRYLLPTSRMGYRWSSYEAEGGWALLGNRRLWIDATAGFRQANRAYLALADATTDYARQVLVPDKAYYGANVWKGYLSVTWQFPLTVKKQRSLWYVSAYADYAHASTHQHATGVGVSFGVFN